MAEEAPLTRVEKLALKFAELANDDSRGKWLQTRFLRGVSYVWVRAALANRMFAEGLDELWAAIGAHRAWAESSGDLAERRAARTAEELREIVVRRLEQKAAELCAGATWSALEADVQERRVDPWSAADDLLRQLG